MPRGLNFVLPHFLVSKFLSQLVHTIALYHLRVLAIHSTSFTNFTSESHAHSQIISVGVGETKHTRTLQGLTHLQGNSMSTHKMLVEKTSVTSSNTELSSFLLVSVLHEPTAS